MQKETGATLVPSFDDPYVIAGQGTVGLEIIDQARQLGARVDQILVPCGGGGLAAGILSAVRGRSSETKVFTVEPAGFDDVAWSLSSGVRERVHVGKNTICDALIAQIPGQLTFPIIQAGAAEGFVVTDDMVRYAMMYAFTALKLVVEPAGAVALAAVLHELTPKPDGACVVVLLGSNVDRNLFVSVLGCSQATLWTF